MWTRSLGSFLCIALLLVPTGAFAVVEISEIMYDLPGTDEGREWIEVQNTGAEAINLAGWKLYENATNHGLVSERVSVLPAGAYAVIADDAEKFSTDWPLYSGPLFSSSFLLKNKGESLALKNASSTVLVMRSYESGAGARGNGNTLNWVNGSFVERAPSPGTSASAAALVVKIASTQAGNSDLKSKVQKSAAPGSSETGGSRSISDSKQIANAQSGFQLGEFSGMIPWILALLGVVALGGGAIFAMKKDAGSGYRIIEEKK